MRRTPRSTLVVAVATLLVLAHASTGRSDDGKAGEVAILPGWKIGDKYRYERVKTRRRISGGKETARASARGTVDVSIVEAGENGFLVRWRIGESKTDDPKAVANPSADAMNRLVEGLTVDLELDNEATITGVRNWAEIKATGSKIIDTAIEAQRAAGVDAGTLGAVRPALQTMLATKERVEQVFTREPLVFFLPVGRAYPGVGKPMEYDDLVPIPLGGPPLPCKGALTLSTYEPAKDRAVIVWTQTSDPKEAARIIRENLKSAFPRPVGAAPKADGLISLTIEDRAEFVIDAKTGWVDRFTQTRMLTTEDGSSEESLSMTRQTNPK